MTKQELREEVGTFLRRKDWGDTRAEKNKRR